MQTASRIAAALLGILVAAHAFAADTGIQRMLLAPGCYQLAAGASAEISSFCLDQTREAPPSGASLANASPRFGNAVVKTASGAQLTLQAALKQHVIALEGAGGYLYVQAKNLTNKPLEICVESPTLVIASGDDYTGDLAKLYEEVVHILAPLGETANNSVAGTGPKQTSQHAALQQKLWEAMNASAEKAAEEQAYKELSGKVLFGSSVGPAPQNSTKPVPGSTKCSGETKSVEVCAGQ
jgi:hypothetical protein